MKGDIQVEKIHAYTGHEDCIYTLERHTSQTFFSSGGDGKVILWDLEVPDTGKMVAKVPSSVYALKYLEDVDQLVVGQNYEGIHVLDLASKKEMGSVKFTEQAIFDIQADEGHLYAGTGDGEIVVFDRSDLTVKWKVKHSDKSVRTILLVADRVLAGYSDNFIRSYDRHTGGLLDEVEAHKISVFSLALDTRSRYLLSASRDAHYKVWDPTSLEMKLDVPAHMYAINHIAFSPDGQHFVTCSMDKSIKVWDSDTFKLKKVIDKARHAGHGTSVNKLLWTDYHDYLISGSDDRSISVWNIKFGR